ncbi:dihydroorotate dehydrogenase [Pseudomonadota bacterium]
MIDLSTKIGKLNLKNPVITSSGTFGYGEEYEDFIDLNKLGGFVTKGTFFEPREGNPYPRIAETASGMLNAIGLQGKGVHYFINETLPRIRKYKTNIIFNACGASADAYIKLAEILNEVDDVDAMEVNFSCPNVKAGCMQFGTDGKVAGKLVKTLRKIYNKTIIIKLTPNVTDIASIAKEIEDAGADAISLINTLKAMAIDAKTRRPKISTVTAGLSGPCIKPVALRMVWEVAKAVKIPVIGLGGISNAEDAIEFLLAGASAIQIGTANFLDPSISMKVIDGINEYLKQNKFNSVQEIIGGLIL